MGIFHAPGLSHGFLEGPLDEDDGGANSLLIVSRVSRLIAEKTPMGAGVTGVVFKLQVDVPETALVADGGQVLSRRRDR